MVAAVHVFRENVTGTGQLVVACPESKMCAIIDPVLDYDASTCTVTTQSADALISFCEEQGYTIQWALDTHIHADHISALYYLKKKVQCKVAIGERVNQVQEHFRSFFGFPKEFISGSYWDSLWKDGDTFSIGNLSVNVLLTPGHTPADVSYYIKDDCIFTGDSIFMPDMGTARCDFPGGSVDDLWESMQKLLSLPPSTRVFVGHDYEPNGRSYDIKTTIARQAEANKHVKEGTSKEEFVSFRQTRDAQLNLPRLLFPAMQFNIRGGMPPKMEGTEQTFVKSPLHITFD